jgi:uncharacterized membrane protein
MPESDTRMRRVAIYSVIGLIDAAVISLRQLGVIRRLPDPPLPYVDSNRVTTSKKAYSLGLPDAPLGALLYAFNLVLAALMASNRAKAPRLARLSLAVSTLAGTGAAADFLYDMFRREKRLCPYCIAAAGMNFASFIEAWRDLSNYS